VKSAKKKKFRCSSSSTHRFGEGKKTYFHRTHAGQEEAEKFSISACDLQNKTRRRSRKRKSKFKSYEKIFHVGGPLAHTLVGAESSKDLLTRGADVGKTFIDPQSDN
jgi:hypothetical protein